MQLPAALHLQTTCNLSMHAGSVQLSRHAVHAALWVEQCVLSVLWVEATPDGTRHARLQPNTSDL